MTNTSTHTHTLSPILHFAIRQHLFRFVHTFECVSTIALKDRVQFWNIAHLNTNCFYIAFVWSTTSFIVVGVATTQYIYLYINHCSLAHECKHNYRVKWPNKHSTENLQRNDLNHSQLSSNGMRLKFSVNKIFICRLFSRHLVWKFAL